MFGCGVVLGWFKISQDKVDVSMTSQVRKPQQTNTLRFNPDEDGKW